MVEKSANPGSAATGAADRGRWWSALIPGKVEIPTVITIATAGLYLIGNQYYESYYNTFGIPFTNIFVPLEQNLLVSIFLLVPYGILVLLVIAAGQREPECYEDAFFGNLPFLIMIALAIINSATYWTDLPVLIFFIFQLFSDIAQEASKYLPWIKFILVGVAILVILGITIFISLQKFSFSSVVMKASVATRLGVFAISLIVLYWFASFLGSSIALAEMLGLKSRYAVEFNLKSSSSQLKGKEVFLVTINKGRYFVFEEHPADFLRPTIWMIPESEVVEARVSLQSYDVKNLQRLADSLL